MWIKRGLLSATLCGVLSPAVAQAPLSAIDWLSDSVAAPAAMQNRPAPELPAIDEPAVTRSAQPEDITTRPIDAPTWDGAGLLSPAVTGLPRTLWGDTPTEEIARMLRRERGDALPAVQDLFYTLLLAELYPPTDSDGRGRLFLARIDKLLDMGALEQALALLEQAGPDRPELFRRWFDVALLMEEEERACNTMRALPQIAPTFPARIFCLARGGDWNAAALTLRTGEALGFITDEEDALLSRFLDPDLYEDDPPLDMPSRPTPLVWRMFEAIGEPIPTATLPVAFAHADLRPNTGWKAQIEAAERLARLGALSPNHLLGLYTERVAAASGGVWDRVSAVQRFDAALLTGDAEAVSEALPRVWPRMAEAGLGVTFAQLYGEQLREISLTGEAAALGFRVALLSPDYEEAARDHDPANPTERFLKALALGEVGDPPDALATAIRDGFSGPDLPQDITGMIDGNRLGEAILSATQRLTEGAAGDLRGAAEGLATLRQVGLEDVARRAALQLMILDRRG